MSLKLAIFNFIFISLKIKIDWEVNIICENVTIQDPAHVLDGPSENQESL